MYVFSDYPYLSVVSYNGQLITKTKSLHFLPYILQKFHLLKGSFEHKIILTIIFVLTPSIFYITNA